jgi:hypothetical protein
MEEELSHTKAALNHKIATIGLGLLFIWWGMVVIVGPLTIGMGAIGTGLILLGVNLVRLRKGIPTHGSTTAIGIIALGWGTLDTVFNPRVGESFAMLLILIGVVMITSLAAHPKTA